jgi:macrolide transport system ATP-binding/permease protein
MGSLAFDLRDVLKSLRRAPGYSTTVVATLALAIGATTAVFSIVNGVLLKPLAYRESRRLVALREVWQQFSDKVSSLEVNAQHFEYWRAHARSFESMAQYIALPANLTGSGDAAQITVVHASGSLFDVLQQPVAIGRALTPDDEKGGRPAVALLTDTCWRERFGGDPAIIGRSIVLDGAPHVVVGILRAPLRLPDRAGLIERPDAVVPIRSVEIDRIGWVGDHNNAAIGRLKPGVTPVQAQAELNVLQTRVSARASDEAHEPVTLASYVSPLTERIVGGARRGLLLLFAAIGAVLLIACSNLANLSLTRTIGRQREVAIRAALGAGRPRLIAIALVEQLLLSAAGGALGLWVAWTALALFVRTAPVELPRVNEVALDGRVLAFAAVLSIAAGLLVAMLPAWRTAAGAVQGALRASGTATTSDRAATRARATLLALQVGLSVTLLVVTGLLSVSFVRLVNVDRGFAADRVLAIGVSMPAARYADERVRLAAYDRLLAALHEVPGVESAATSSMLPLAGQGQVNFIRAAGDTRSKFEQPSANFRFIAPEYFRTLGVPILRGRAFTESEREADRDAPALVSERTASRLWPAQDALGKHFSRGEVGEQGFEVVGVVADARTTTLEGEPPLMVYAPYWWRSRAALSVLIKTTADPFSLMPAIRRAVREVDPEIAIGRTRSLDDIVDASFAARRYQMRLFIAFGAVALAIAIVGVYAVTAYGVSRRRREMNIRVALGARTSQVVRMIVQQGSAPIAAGVVGGAVGAFAIGGLVASLLFDVSARDPLVITAVVAAVGAAGLVACFVAARQGLVINPASALREE